ncbi:MAG: beta-galactosidase [Lentisphaeria bacterium]|nr:beta-galactosidase [Lentisphaeria bacterium]
MKKILITFFCMTALLLAADDLLRNAPWRFVTASGGTGSVEKIANGTRKVISDADEGFVSFAHSRNLPITPGNKYRITMTCVRENADTNMTMLVSIGKRTPWAAVKADGIAGKPEILSYEFTAEPGESGMRVHAIVSGHGSVTITSVARSISAPEVKPVKSVPKAAIDPAIHDLLRDAPWRTVTADGGKGKTLSLADGSRKIISELNKGLVSFANTRNLPIMPGKTYLVEAEFVRSSNAPFSMHVQIEKQRPWVAIKADGIAGKPERISYRFTANPGETWMRIHAIVFNKNTVTIQKITYRETSATDPDENWLITRPWRTVTADGGSGTSIKQSDGKWLVTSNLAQGIVSFANAADQQIIPGKNYRVTAKIIRNSSDVSVTMLNQIAKRRPWAAIKADGLTGQEDTLTYDFTAGENEKTYRLHFIVSGKGSVQINSVNVKELSHAELQAAQNARKVTGTDFRGSALRRFWKPVNMRSRIPGKIQAFTCTPYGGLECNDLDWQADKIKSIDIRMAANEPGFLRLEFTTAAGQNSYLSCAAYPYEMRDYSFDVASNPAWQGKITNLRIIWRAYERNCTLDFERISANNRNNIIPFAADNKSRQITTIDLLPRAECSLSWQNGSNPGMTLTFLDRSNRKLDQFVLPAEKKQGVFFVPEMCTRAILDIDRNAKTSGFPCIEELNLSKPDKKAFDWRGKWIWSNTEFGPANANVWFKKEFTLDGEVKEGAVIFTADDMFTAYINGQEVCSGDSWRTPVRADAAKFLKPGLNTIIIKTHNVSAWGGMIGEVYAQAGGKVYFFPTDDSWVYKVGGDNPPEKYTANALVLGAPPTSPWGDLVYSYIGPKGNVEIKSAGELSAVIKPATVIPVKTDSLTFKLNYPDGTSRQVSGKVSPGTEQWLPGKELPIKIALPETAVAGVTAEFDSLFINASGKLCTLPAADIRKLEIPTAKIIGTGSRAYITINGEKYPPIYYDGYHKPANSWMLDKAKKSGCRIVRITCSMHQMWKSEENFDFSILDRFMDEFAVNAPEIKVILQIELTMPDWWLEKYPDDTVTYHNGIPRSKAHDRQALASARWRQDGAHSLRKMIRHIKSSPYADRIFAIGPAEGWNCEWFWSVHRGATSGYSKSDYATFRTYLKEAYGDDAAFAQAWNIPGLTFENFKMPLPAEIDRAGCGELLDPVKDRRIMDYFRFRNRALGDAIETFGKVIKEESDNRYLVGVYYGYFVMFSHVNRKLQTVGHLEIERLARSPYVDIFWAPSIYHWRQIGMSDGVMQAAETLTSHGKLVVVEQDIRTFSEPSHMQAGNGRTDNPHQTINAMIRALGMLATRGIGTHWYDMHEIWFRENVLLEIIKNINETYMALPQVKDTTPIEVCIVSDQENAYYTRHNFARNIHKGTVYEFLRTFNRTGVPFRHVFVKDLLEKDRIPAHKFYILTNLVMMTPEKYRQLEQRFAAENATVLHLYATGASRHDAPPSAANMEELLGMKFRMDMTPRLPDFTPIANVNMPAFANAIYSQPWFYPVSGFDKVLGTDRAGTPVLVKKKINGINHIFSTLTTPHVDVLRELFRNAGIHIYSPDSRNNLHIGNDLLFITATHTGNTSVNLPSNRKLRGIIGEHNGKIFESGADIPVVNGDCYGFIVE